MKTWLEFTKRKKKIKKLNVKYLISDKSSLNSRYSIVSSSSNINNISDINEIGGKKGILKENKIRRNNRQIDAKSKRINP